jgi:hypothetical protein
VAVPFRQVRADFDDESIVVYQAFNGQIADGALRNGHFVNQFSRHRMTWVKPSFLGLMERSGWGSKTNQERTLAVTITREGWEHAVGNAELTSYTPDVSDDHDSWRRRLELAEVRVQWDPERDLRGAKLAHRSIEDYSPLVRRIRDALDRGDRASAERLCAPEREYVLAAPDVAARLGISRT